MWCLCNSRIYRWKFKRNRKLCNKKYRGKSQRQTSLKDVRNTQKRILDSNGYSMDRINTIDEKVQVHMENFIKQKNQFSKQSVAKSKEEQVQRQELKWEILPDDVII